MFKHVMMVIILLPAYVQAEPTVSDCDFNNNGQVDFPDFIAFAQAFGTDQVQFDLDGNNLVDFQDFIIFVQFFGQETTPTSIPIGLRVGQRAPDFTLKTLTNTPFKLHDQRGKPVFLNFWATWCGPCLVEMPDMEKLQQAMGDQILIVGIDIQEPLPHVQRFVRFYKYTWTFVLDSSGDVSIGYGVSAIPTSIFIDAKGVIVRKFRGAQSYATFLEAAQQAINN